MKPPPNLPLKPRHMALGAALLAAAALVLFGDRSPNGEVAEAVQRPAAVRTDARAGTVSAGTAPGVSAPAVAGGDAALLPAATSSKVAAGGAGAAAAAAAGGASDAHGSAAAGQQILALVPRDILIGDSEGRFGQAQNGGAPFGSHSWTPPPPPPPPQASAPSPPPPPSAPPLPFTFIGKSVGQGVIEVYLARGDRTFVARANTVIDGTYRVDAVAPPVLTLTYLPLNQVQQLNIGVFE